MINRLTRYINFWLLIICIITFLPIKTSFAGNQISKISLENMDYGMTNLKFNLSKLPKYRAFTIKEPDRLVLDFDQTSLLKSALEVRKHEMFRNIRNSINSQGQVRIVFDLNKKIEIKRTSIRKISDNNYVLDISVNYVKDNKTASNADPILNLLERQDKQNTYKIKSNVNKPIIVIDAGHGGKDPGAIGRYGKTKEKFVTLAFARELKKELDKTGKYKAYLTRRGDYFISLGGRVEKSRNVKADLFISLHADSSPNRDTTGLSIYTLSDKASDKNAQKLAAKENKSDIIGGADFSGASNDILKTLINLSQRSSMNESAKFAEIAIQSLKKNNINILQNTHRFAGFMVLTAPDMPSVLVELGYLSNKSEERKLNSYEYRKNVAKSFVEAIGKYFSTVR